MNTCVYIYIYIWALTGLEITDKFLFRFNSIFILFFEIISYSKLSSESCYSCILILAGAESK